MKEKIDSAIDPAVYLESADAKDESFVLRLYVTGTTPHSTRAIVNLRKICDEHLKGRYQLEVIDISERPEVAQAEQIIAAPTLIKQLPLPLRRIIGDLSQTARILVGLDLRVATRERAPV